MLHLIIFLALLPAAIGTVIWIALMLCAVASWIFMAPFRLMGWLIRTAKGA
jgi:hypothetical protein